MRQQLCGKPQRRCEMLSAAILNDPGEMVRQMALPLVPERRVKGALEVVSRETGLSYSKTYRLFYNAARDVWRAENKKIVEAFKRFTLEQERAYRNGAERLAALNAEIDRLERQYGMDLEIDARVAGAVGLDRTHA